MARTTKALKRSRAPRRRAARAPAARYAPPLSVSHRALLVGGDDEAFREVIYYMILSFGRLEACRDFFGRMLGLTGSQFAVLIGTAHRQGAHGITIRALAQYVQLASTHVTTEVGRLMRKRLLQKRPNREDARSVLVSLTPLGEQALAGLAPVLREVNDALFRGIGRQEFLALRGFLERFSANTEEAMAAIARRRGG